MKVLTIAANDVRRLLRWRANLFFLFVLPMLVILLLGAAFGGSQRAKIGVVNRDRSTLSRQFVGALRQHPSTTARPGRSSRDSCSGASRSRSFKRSSSSWGR